MPTQDYSSSVTGSSVFDFDGDGKAEVVYADECFSRVYDGRSGDVLHSQYRTSCTWYENPIVADVDGDLRSEIVIPSNDNCGIACPAVDPAFDGLRCDTSADCPAATTCADSRCRCVADADCGPAADGYVCADPIAGASPDGKVCRAGHPATSLQGVRVIRDALDRWVNSRPIWNQHAYAVTNVNDDGTIPRTSAWRANWKTPGLNDFRQNKQGTVDPSKLPDLTAGAGAAACDGSGGMTLSANVCDRGTADAGGGVTLTFFDDAGQPICSTTTQHTLAPGGCEPVSCDWATPPSGPVDVTAVVDPDHQRAECHEGNNGLTLQVQKCGTIG
jgi:hypothetical protein